MEHRLGRDRRTAVEAADAEPARDDLLLAHHRHGQARYLVRGEKGLHERPTAPAPQPLAGASCPGPRLDPRSTGPVGRASTNVMRASTRLRWALFVVVLSAALTACGDHSSKNATTTPPACRRRRPVHRSSCGGGSQPRRACSTPDGPRCTYELSTGCQNCHALAHAIARYYADGGYLQAAATGRSTSIKVTPSSGGDLISARRRSHPDDHQERRRPTAGISSSTRGRRCSSGSGAGPARTSSPPARRTRPGGRPLCSRWPPPSRGRRRCRSGRRRGRTGRPAPG